jgi:hypothetical protein
MLWEFVGDGPFPHMDDTGSIGSTCGCNGTGRLIVGKAFLRGLCASLTIVSVDGLMVLPSRSRLSGAPTRARRCQFPAGFQWSRRYVMKKHGSEFTLPLKAAGP